MKVSEMVAVVGQTLAPQGGIMIAETQAAGRHNIVVEAALCHPESRQHSGAMTRRHQATVVGFPTKDQTEKEDMVR